MHKYPISHSSQIKTEKYYFSELFSFIWNISDELTPNIQILFNLSIKIYEYNHLIFVFFSIKFLKLNTHAFILNSHVLHEPILSFWSC